MTPNDQDPIARLRGNSADEVDKLLDHHRLQLSALIDGELPPEQARFLLRRLEHDAELRGCWERWQFSGDVMRGQAGTRLREGFAARVADAVAAQPRATRGEDTRGLRWLRWGGSAAIAASVAVMAVFLTRQSPGLQPPSATQSPTQVVADATPSRTPTPPSPASPVDAPAAHPSTPGQLAQVATALAVADAPRRLAPRRSRGQSQRAALRTPARAAAESPIAMAAATPAFGNTAIAVDLFSGQHVRLTNRPWPRALLPGSVANGAFNVDYGTRGVGMLPQETPSPFAPRPLAPVPATDAQAAPPAPH